MPGPLLDPVIFAPLCWGIGGGLLGTLVGTAGGVGGTLARRGRRPTWVRVVLAAVLLGGCVSLVVGAYALLVGQPSSVWVPLMSMGLLWGVVSIGTMRALRQLYEDATKGMPAGPGAGADRGRG